MKRAGFLILFLAIGGISAVRSQEIVPGRGTFQVDYDYASFAGDSVQAYFELYYGIHENMVSYRHAAGGLSGSVDFRWVIRNDSVQLASREWTVPHSVNDTSDLLHGQSLVGLQSVGLPPGHYKMTLVASDPLNAARHDSVTFPVDIARIDSQRETLSDIELCTSVQSSTNRKSLFYKNTLEVIPNPGRLYGTGLPILYYYAEAYNLDFRTDQSRVIVHAAVLDALGKEVATNERQKPRMAHSSVEIGTLNLSAIHGGSYQFQLSVLDTSRNVLAVSSKRFFVYKLGGQRDTSLTAGLADYTVSEYGVMTAADCDRAFGEAIYIATGPERDQYERLTDVNAKRKFLFEFWKRRDMSPESPLNESKTEYQKRVEEATRQYSWGMRQGWKTDRGRVLIVYGTPDEIERFPSQSGSNPYEIWHYNNLEGGIIFVFVDRRAMGDYGLVHSTSRNELHDENWFQHYAEQGQ
jgi:GWxTD domain-containing protein